MTLIDIIGWNLDADAETEKKDPCSLEDIWKLEETKLKKLHNIMTNKKFST